MIKDNMKYQEIPRKTRMLDIFSNISSEESSALAIFEARSVLKRLMLPSAI